MELNEFLVKAKVEIYASNGEGVEVTLEDSSKEQTYQEGVNLAAWQPSSSEIDEQ